MHAFIIFQVVQLSTVPFAHECYVLIGLLPADYVTSSNGAIIQGLCSGRDAYWAVPSSESSGESELQGRDKRASSPAYYYSNSICDCPSGTCWCTRFSGFVNWNSNSQLTTLPTKKSSETQALADPEEGAAGAPPPPQKKKNDYFLSHFV